MAKDPSRTEEATPKRINKARNDGNVPRSQEASKAINVLAGYCILLVWLPYVGQELLMLFRRYLVVPPHPTITPNEAYITFLFVAQSLAKILLPILLFIAVCIILVIRLQVGQLWTTKVFKPKLSKFNPLKGIKRMLFSAQTFIRLGRSLAQALLIGLAPVLVIKSDMLTMIDLFDYNVTQIVITILELGKKMVKYALVPILLMGVIDLWYTRWKYKEDLKMTKSEVKDEFKQMEGDLQLKSKMRQKMMSMVMRSAMSNVPKADVVITNPTHLAIALKYDAKEAPAPIVVAKGANHMAEKIKQIAKDNKVPVRQNVPLARALYKQTEIGDMIPAELYQAVALVLAQIWKNDPSKQQRKT